MRTSIIALAATAVVALATYASSGTARADNEYDVTAANGKVTVHAKGNWHINKDYPWKLVAGSNTIDKSKFTLAEKEATVSGAPKGAATLKGAICSGDTCKPFSAQVNVP